MAPAHAVASTLLVLLLAPPIHASLFHAAWNAPQSANKPSSSHGNSNSGSQYAPGLDSDVCKVYGNRRPLTCVRRHNLPTTTTSTKSRLDTDPADPRDDDQGWAGREDDSSSPGEDDDRPSRPHAAEGGKGGDAPPPPPPPLPPRPLAAAAGSRAEADDLARQDEESYGSGDAGAVGHGGGESDRGAAGAAAAGGRGKAAGAAEQELQDELQAERRRRQRRRRGEAPDERAPRLDPAAEAATDPTWFRAATDLTGRSLDDDEGQSVPFDAAGLESRAGAVSTWEACPKVLHSEYHDYFEFILCNAGFAALAILVLAFRQRTLALQQFGRLAARIMQTQTSTS
ncbi:hypothetical protein JCM8202v2_003872 [Rhodotorula sphaerocarpa]